MTAPPTPVWRAPSERGGSLLRLRYASIDEWAEFVIDERGERVWIGHSETVLLCEAAELLLGPVFTCVLTQRGRTCLHASVVALSGRVLALVGSSGSGKSSTAAALIERGGSVICDDVAALTEREGRFVISPGTAQLRIRSEAAPVVVGAFDELEPIWAHEHLRPAKRYTRGGVELANPDRLAVDAVYLLGAREAPATVPSVSALAAVQALPLLMANRHLADTLDRAAHSRDFELLARLAESVPVRELRRPEGLDAITQTAAAIAADTRRLS